MQPIRAISHTIRDTRRFADVLRVLVRHGFTEIVREIGIDRLLARGQAMLAGGEAPDSRRQPREVRLRMVLEELGPTFIKLGQILATRPDLVPKSFADEFEKLHSNVPATPFSEIRKRLDEELGDRLDSEFASIEEEPLGSASIAQVHRARLKDGTEVVVKVLRPGIRPIIEADMEVLGELARLAERYFSEMGFSPVAVVDEFSQELRKELDFQIEARSTQRLRKLFEGDPHVTFPRVYPSVSTSSVLTLSFMKGRLLGALDYSTLSDEERREIVAHGSDAVFRMCLEWGFFHADPHPGNIILMPDGRVCFIDCGMTGRIEPRTSEALADLVISTVKGDLDKVVRTIVEIADAGVGLQRDRRFRIDVWEFVARFQHASMEELDMAALLERLFELLRKYKIRCPGDLVFLLKALMTIQAVGEAIDPGFPLIEHVQPHLEQLVKRRYSMKAIRGRVTNSLVEYMELLESIPGEVASAAHELRREGFNITLEHSGLERLTESVDHASRIIGYALVIAAIIVGSAILILADSGGWGLLTNLGIAGIAVGSVLTGHLLLGAFRLRGRRRGQ